MNVYAGFASPLNMDWHNGSHFVIVAENEGQAKELLREQAAPYIKRWKQIYEKECSEMDPALVTSKGLSLDIEEWRQIDLLQASITVSDEDVMRC